MMDEPEEGFGVTQKGLDILLQWCRLKLQVADILGRFDDPDDEPGLFDDDTTIPWLVLFLVTEAYLNRGLPLPRTQSEDEG